MIVYYLVTALHVLVCVILILVVLLQSGKGADLAGAFGGGATQTAFGSRGPASFLSKMTTAAAVLFMMTSLGLSLMKTRSEQKSILDTTPGRPAPASKAPAVQPQVPAPTPDQIRQRQEEIQQQQQKQQQEKSSGQQAQPPSGSATPQTAPAPKK